MCPLFFSRAYNLSLLLLTCIFVHLSQQEIGAALTELLEAGVIIRAPRIFADVPTFGNHRLLEPAF